VQNLAQVPGGVSILRGTTVDDYGDLVDADTPAYTGIPAAIVESARTVTDPSSQVARTIRAIICIMPGWADVLNSDRLQDPSGNVYEIESLEAQPSLGYPADTILTLRRVTGTGK
jgi:hypothetical protein